LGNVDVAHVGHGYRVRELSLCRVISIRSIGDAILSNVLEVADRLDWHLYHESTVDGMEIEPTGIVFRKTRRKRDEESEGAYDGLHGCLTWVALG